MSGHTAGPLRALVLAAMMTTGQHAALAHEATPVAPSPEILLGDEASDAMATGSITPHPAGSCGADSKAPKMPFANAGHPDEAP